MPEAVREFFVPGGTLPVDSESYIERPADRDLLDHLIARRYCYVLNSRQVGKSSLSVRTIARLREHGIKTAFIDLTQIGGRNVEAAQWYAGLLAELGRTLDLMGPVLTYFKSQQDLSPMQRFFGALREVVLPALPEPLVIFIDEIDATRNLPFDADEFFAGIRECYNRRVQDESAGRLTFCLLGVAVPTDLSRDSSTTPFNIGERIRLQDFTLQDLVSFARVLGSNGGVMTERVHYWTGGQPYLTQSLCHEIANHPEIQDAEGVDALVSRQFFGPNAVETNLNLADVANRVLNEPGQAENAENFRADLLSVYDRVVKGSPVKDDEANRVKVVLKLAGLVKPEGRRLIVRNRIYARVFDHAWVHTNMPGQELVRQRQSFRRGVIRGISWAAAVGTVIAALGLVALRAREDALRAKAALDYELYVADMSSLRLFDEMGDSARMAAVLNRSASSSYRNFEWNFWMGRLHDSPEEYTLDYSAPGKLEQGFLSLDGSQVCVEDKALDIAVVLDRKTKRELGSTPWDNRTVFASDEGLLSIRQGNDPAEVVNLATGRVVCHVGSPGYRLGYVVARDQGNFVVTVESSIAKPAFGLLEVWDVRSGKCVFRLGPDRGIGLPCAISRDGRRVAFLADKPPPDAGSAGSGLVVWDIPANKTVDLIPQSEIAEICDLSPSGKLLAYWDLHQVVKLRDIERRQTVFTTPAILSDIPISVTLAADDKSMVWISSNGVATVRDIPTGRVLAVRTKLWHIEPAGIASLWMGGSSTVRLLDLSPRGQGIVGSAQHLLRDGLGSIRFFDQAEVYAPVKETRIARLSDSTLSALPGIAIPKGVRNLTYNGLWGQIGDPRKPGEIVQIGGSAAPIRLPYPIANFACGIRAHVVLVMRNDNMFIGIDGRTGRELWEKRYDPSFRGIWMSPDETRILGSTLSGRIALIDPRSGAILHWSGAHKLTLSVLSFSRDGRFFLTGGGDGQAILWNTDTLAKLVQFGGNTAQEVESVDLSPDGKRVATCNVTGAWQIWDAATGQELTEVRASDQPLRSVMFSSDGKKLVTAGDDGTVRCWSGLDKDPTFRLPLPAKAAKNLGF